MGLRGSTRMQGKQKPRKTIPDIAKQWRKDPKKKFGSKLHQLKPTYSLTWVCLAMFGWVGSPWHDSNCHVWEISIAWSSSSSSPVLWFKYDFGLPSQGGSKLGVEIAGSKGVSDKAAQSLCRVVWPAPFPTTNSGWGRKQLGPSSRPKPFICWDDTYPLMFLSAVW